MTTLRHRWVRHSCIIALALLTACADDVPPDNEEDVAPTPDLAGDLDAGAEEPVPDVVDEEVSEPQVVHLKIAYDYRFDSLGFFETAASRGVLEEAARQWGVVLYDDFDEIPTGTTIYVRDPQDTSQESYLTLDSPIDDLLVFVGSAPRASSAAGSSATALIPSEDDDPVLRAALLERWEGDDFEPWTGWIQFNSDRDWFFDETFGTDDDLPDGATDALTTAVHELGHVLGIGPGGAFARLVQDGTFVGPHAMAVYGGPVPLADAYGHIAEDVTIDGQTPIMATGRIRGRRYAITRLDIAMMADIGYQIEE